MNFKMWIEADVFFHGTPTDFDQFSFTYVGKGHDQEGPGFYFTNKDINATTHGKNIIKAHLALNKTVPLKGKPKVGELRKLIKMAPDLEDKLMNWDENPVKAFNAALKAMCDQANPHQAFMSVWFDFYRGHEAQYLQNMTQLGYDGVIVPQMDGSIHAIMFSPDKIQRI